MMRHARNAFLVTVLFAFSLSGFGDDKTGLKWFSFNDGLAHAKKTNKKVLVDVYTDWCGWCKKMDKDTYAERNVAAYLNTHYVAIKLNAESPAKVTYNGETFTEQELAGAFGISGYPSIIFLKAGGEPITTYPGYADAAKFMRVASFIAEDHYLTKKFEEYAGTTK